MPPARTFSLEKARQLVHAFESAFDQGDYKAMASFYAENATLISDNSETLQGRHAIERFWQAACTLSSAKKIKRTTQIQHIDVSSGLGYVLGSIYLETPISDRQTNMSTVPYVTLWKRQPDGAWRLALDIAHQNHA
jgi:uncharacterized protein (TIGR02246 family)